MSDIFGTVIDVAKGAWNGLTDGASDAVDDFSKVGKNNFQPTPYDVQQQNWGGYAGADADMAAVGLGGVSRAGANQNYAQGQMQGNRGPRATENQALSDQESQARGYHQNAALDMALQGAMGNRPSEAAWMLQRGLDGSVAAQQSAMGSARGAASLATAGSNAAANTAQLQGQAFTSAGQLRAKEMADNLGMYGGLAGQQRSQDQNRLAMGNAMGQFNAGLNDQYKLGMGKLGVENGQLANNWYQSSMHPYDQQYQGDLSQEHDRGEDYNKSLGLGASISGDEADRQNKNKQQWIGFVRDGLGASGKSNDGGGVTVGGNADGGNPG